MSASVRADESRLELQSSPNDAAPNALQQEWSNIQSSRSTDSGAHDFDTNKSISGLSSRDAPNLELFESKLYGTPSAAAANQDVRQGIVHLAKYHHCTFADKDEYVKTVDKALNGFAEKPDVSTGMKPLQKMVDNFLKDPNKDGLKEFCSQYLKFWGERRESSLQTMRELDAEAKSMTPARKAADADMDKKTKEFFSALDKLPQNEKERVMGLIDWQDDVSREQRNQRVRDGLKDNPRLLSLYNAMERADERLAKLKSPRERTLTEEHRKNVRDNVLADSIKELARRRSLRS